MVTSDSYSEVFILSSTVALHWRLPIVYVSASFHGCTIVMASDPFTIRIFVPDGDPEGVRIIDRLN